MIEKLDQLKKNEESLYAREEEAGEKISKTSENSEEEEGEKNELIE